MKRDLDSIDDATQSGSASTENPSKRRKCPYLDTINKHLLDFDFEKVCSITLTNQNVYACLVCGNYFQGRGKNTHAYTHSVQMSHHVFINLSDDRIYCLPDNYEVIDQSLKYIKDALRPSFSPQQIMALDQNRTLAQDAFGVSYLPGFVGMNNLKNTDYVSVVIQALAHIPPLRDFFLVPSNYKETSKSALVHRFGEIIRKMWSPKNIKNTISPHEILQEISVASNKRFQIGVQNEAVDLLSWLLNELHRGLVGSVKKKKKATSIIHKVFQGKVNVTTSTEVARLKAERKMNEETKGEAKNGVEMVEESKALPFLFLSLDLPPTPLFKDSQGGNVIPQIPLLDVLEKFNGEKVTHVLRGALRQQKVYSLKSLPQYLIFHVARFTKNNFFVEKNPTIVNFPLKDLDMRDYLDVKDNFKEDELPSEEELKTLSVQQLKDLLAKHKISEKNCVEKRDLVERFESFVTAKKKHTMYNLIANVCHDSKGNIGKEAMTTTNPLTEGSYRVHVKNRATEQWYEIQDLHVQETMPQIIGLSESYLMIYERQQ